MLTREQEPGRADATYPKDFAVGVELFEWNIKEVEGIFGENVLVGNVAEVSG